MKPLIQRILFLEIIFIIISFQVNGQEIETVKLPEMKVDASEVPQIGNSVEYLNYYLINEDGLRFRKEIKQARKKSDYILYQTPTKVIHISKLDYLKKLRIAANRSENVKGFYDRMLQYYPDLDTESIDDLNFLLLYPRIREYTLNGYIESLRKANLVFGDFD